MGEHATSTVLTSVWTPKTIDAGALLQRVQSATFSSWTSIRLQQVGRSDRLVWLGLCFLFMGRSACSFGDF